MKISRDLDELEGLIALKREHVLKQLSGITLLDRQQVAERLGVSTSQVYRASRKGELARINIDRKPRFAVSDVQVYIESRRVTGHRRRSPKSGKTGAAPLSQGHQKP